MNYDIITYVSYISAKNHELWKRYVTLYKTRPSTTFLVDLLKSYSLTKVTFLVGVVVVALSWDGKHSKSLVRESYGQGKKRNVKKNKEVITVTDMQNKSYVGDFRADSAKGKAVAEGVVSKAQEKRLALTNVKFVCGDSTASMTGYKDGSFAYHYYSYGEFVHAFRQFFRGGASEIW